MFVVFTAIVASTLKRRLKGNATIVETLRYLSREIRVPHSGIISFRVAVNLNLNSWISYSSYSAVRDSSFSQRLALLQSLSSRTTLEPQ